MTILFINKIIVNLNTLLAYNRVITSYPTKLNTAYAPSTDQSDEFHVFPCFPHRGDI